MYWKTRLLNAKRKRRIERLLQKNGLLDARDEINRIWVGMLDAEQFTL